MKGGAALWIAYFTGEDVSMSRAVETALHRYYFGDVYGTAIWNSSIRHAFIA